MENKYYTPSIEEFFVGFEYEWYSDLDRGDNSKTWYKTEYDFDKRYELDEPVYFLEEGIDKEFIRVKYLDSSDIEELGFVSEPYFKDVDYFGYRKGNIRLYLLENDRVEITTEDKKFESYYFLGIVKNKSELKKVLNMLNIK